MNNYEPTWPTPVPTEKPIKPKKYVPIIIGDGGSAIIKQPGDGI